jgi:hypothetical protein
MDGEAVPRMTSRSPSGLPIRGIVSPFVCVSVLGWLSHTAKNSRIGHTLNPLGEFERTVCHSGTTELPVAYQSIEHVSTIS